MSTVYFSKDHVWVVPENGTAARIGISRFAREELGEIVYIELPKPGKTVARDEGICAFDSLKSSSEVYAPVSGTIGTVNPALSADDGLSVLNEDPEGAGWLFTIEMKNASELNDLMDRAAYDGMIKG